MGGRGASKGNLSVRTRTIPTGSSVEVIASRRIRNVINELNDKKFARYQSFSIGNVDSEMSAFASENDIHISSKQIYMTSDGISHSLRPFKKNIGKSVDEKTLVNFPKNRKSMHIFYDKVKQNFIYTDYKSKFIVHPNYRIKIFKHKSVKANFITASKAQELDFNGKNFVKIK